MTADQSAVAAVDYGPLTALLGTWAGSDGMDVSPESDGVEESRYYETIEFTAAGDVTNAEQQTLSVVRYHQVVRRSSNDEVFHDQIGYWLWNAADGSVAQTLTIPRGVAVVAHGQAEVDGSRVRVSVAADASGIAQTPFMATNAATTGYSHEFELAGDQLRYQQTTVLSIYGRRNFAHTDGNTLRRERPDSAT